MISLVREETPCDSTARAGRRSYGRRRLVRRPFDDPIPVPDGRVLKTLYDAGHYAAALPKAAQERSDPEMLILAAGRQRPVMFAEIAMRRALADLTHVELVSKPTRRRKHAAYPM